MAESMKQPAPEPERRRPARKPRIPHPRLEPLQKPAGPAAPAEPTEPTEDTASWTEAAVPRPRPSSQRRGRASRQTPAERMLRTALRIGLVLNATALILPRLIPVDWRYGASDFLLAGAVLLSGYALLAVGRLDRQD